MSLLPEWLILSRESIAYLTLFVLSAVIIGILLLTRERRAAQWYLIGFFSAIALFFLVSVMIFCSYLDVWFLIQYPFLLLSTLFLIQFAYHYPQADERWVRERRMVLGLSLLVVATTLVLGVGVLQLEQSVDLFAQLVLFSRVTVGLETLWAVIVLLRLRRRDGSTTDQARVAFALSFTIPVGLASLAVAERSGLGLAAQTYHYLLNVGFLAFFFSFIMAYLNYASERHSFMSKLVLSVLVLLLGVVQLLAQAAFGDYDEEFTTRERAWIADYLALDEGAASSAQTDLAFILVREAGTGVRGYRVERQLDAAFSLDYVHAKGLRRGAAQQAGPTARAVYKTLAQSQAGREYLFGFRLVAYRDFINPRAFPYLLALLAGTLTIILIFPLFFRRSLVTPLEELMNGVRQVNQGNLEVAIPVRYQDEIGQLTHAFNGMTRSVKEAEQSLLELNRAYERFVPHEFLNLIQRNSILDVRLGDCMQREVAVLFSDIRHFTHLSESMSPEDNFRFLNSYLVQMEPIILRYRGFIDKYIGDAIMALFPGGADDALRAAIAMRRQLVDYNHGRKLAGYSPIEVGIGINMGESMFGTIGGRDRMEGTVISDAVNVASRLEGLTKRYGVNLLLSEYIASRLQQPELYHLRTIDQVRVKGKSAPITLVEAFDHESAQTIALRQRSADTFARARDSYQRQEYAQAKLLFEQVLQLDPGDRVARLLCERCERFVQQGVPEGWDGIETLSEK